MKIFVKIISPLILAVAFGFWWIFIKSEAVKDPNYLSVCLNHNELKVERAESAKYFSDFEWKAVADTLEISVRTTTVLNPFSNKEISKVILLPSNIKFIKLCNKNISLSTLRACQY